MHSRGFTLVEMLVVMTISAILIAAAVPAFSMDDRAQSHFRCDQSASFASRVRAHGSFAAATTVSICRTPGCKPAVRPCAAARPAPGPTVTTGRPAG